MGAVHFAELVCQNNANTFQLPFLLYYIYFDLQFTDQCIFKDYEEKLC